MMLRLAEKNRGHVTGVATGHMIKAWLTKRFSLAYASGCEAAAGVSKCTASCPVTQSLPGLVCSNHKIGDAIDNGNSRARIMTKTVIRQHRQH